MKQGDSVDKIILNAQADGGKSRIITDVLEIQGIFDTY